MSEKPFDTSTPRDRPTLLLDENLSSADIAQFLRQIRSTEWQIELHTDHFARGLPDVDVIRECGARGWILVSCDDRIRYVPENKGAVIKHAVHAFMFGKGNYQGIEYAAALVVGRGQMFTAIRKHAGPLIARIQRNGDVVILEPQQAVDMTSKQKTARRYGKGGK